MIDPWSSIIAATIVLVLAVITRRVLLAGQKRGMISILFLSIAIFARLAATGAERLGNERIAPTIDFFHPLFFALGISSFADIILFDAFLERLRIHVPRIMRDILQAAAFFVIVLGLLGTRGVDVLPLVTTSAVLTAVIGLALQSTIANLFAGLALQLDRSFGIGDWVTIGERTGRITQIKWRSTSIYTRDGDLLIVPNQHLTTHEVLNLSEPTKHHRVRFQVSVDYAHPPNEVKRVFLEAIRGTPGVLSDPAPNCVPSAFGNPAIVYDVLYWMDDQSRDMSIEGEVRTRLYYAAKRAGFELCPSSRIIYVVEEPETFKGALPSSHDLADRSLLLKKIDLLSPLTEEDRRLLIAKMRRVRFAAGETILRQGAPGDSLYLIHLGEVSVVLTGGGEEREVATLGPGNFIGEISLLTGEPRAATCRAKTDVTAYVVDHVAFQELLATKPELAEEISRVLGERMLELTNQQDAMSAESKAQRSAEASGRVLVKIRRFFNLQ
jgi:small-conductance mechanosensitive channel/CRP-like cAMP-binding protein